MSVPDLTMEQGIELIKAAFVDELQEILRYRTEMTKDAGGIGDIFRGAGRWLVGRGGGRAGAQFVGHAGAEQVSRQADDITRALSGQRGALSTAESDLAALRGRFPKTGPTQEMLAQEQALVRQMEQARSAVGAGEESMGVLGRDAAKEAPELIKQLEQAGGRSWMTNPFGRAGRAIHRAVTGGPRSAEEFIARKAEEAGFTDPNMFLAQVRTDPVRWGAMQAEMKNIMRPRTGLGLAATGGGIYGGGKLLGDQMDPGTGETPGGWTNIALGGLGGYGSYKLLEQAGLPEWAQLLGGAAGGIYTPRLLG